MALSLPFTGFSVGDSFVVTPSDTVKVVADPNNLHVRPYIWVVPLTVGTMAALDLNGIAISVTFAAKDLNVCFPVPVTQVKATGTTATFIGVYQV